MVSDEVPGLLDQVLKYFGMMQFGKRFFFKDIQCPQILKLIAALCPTYSLPPSPFVPPRIYLDC